jgi:hypothetical protein
MSAASGSPEDAAAAVNSLIKDLNSKVSQSVSMLGGSGNPAAAALQAAMLPISAAAQSVSAGLSGAGASGSSADITGLIDQLAAAVGDAGSNLASGLGSASAGLQDIKAAARTLVAAEGLSGSLNGVVADLRAQLKAAGSAPAGSQAAEDCGQLMKASLDEIMGQLQHLKLAGLVSMDEESDEGAAAAAALEKLLASVQAKGEALAGQVQSGQMKGAAALDEVRALHVFSTGFGCCCCLLCAWRALMLCVLFCATSAQEVTSMVCCTV